MENCIALPYVFHVNVRMHCYTNMQTISHVTFCLGGLSVSRGLTDPTLTFAFLLSPWKATKMTKRPPLATHSSRQSHVLPFNNLSVVFPYAVFSVVPPLYHWPRLQLQTNVILAEQRETCCFNWSESRPVLPCSCQSAPHRIKPYCWLSNSSQYKTPLSFCLFVLYELRRCVFCRALVPLAELYSEPSVGLSYISK